MSSERERGRRGRERERERERKREGNIPDESITAKSFHTTILN